MARIRTIKPEFPQSESIGRISRDARLLFIMLWTICDDAGRTRANSRMLASLLYPYDDDARALITGWLEELEAELCLKRYQVDGHNYLEICNWLNHQKIDKPSPSKIPPFSEPSPTPREDSRSLPVGREGKGMDQGEEGNGVVAKPLATIHQLQLLVSLGVEEQHAIDWLEVRKKKKAPKVSQTVIDGISREASIANISFANAIRICAEKGWQGFDASWMQNARGSPSVQDARLQVADQIMGRKNHGNGNKIIDVTPIRSDAGDGKNVPKVAIGIRESASS